MSNENVVASQLAVMSKNLNMKSVDIGSLYQTLKTTVFKDAKDDNEFAALMVVANQYGLNPFTKEIYAFAKGGKVTPIVSVDGWARLVNDNPQCDGIQFEQDDDSAICKIYRKDRSHPTVVTEYLAECKMNTEPWKKYPKRMLRHKAFIQCARMAFGFSGIYDEDEAHRINGGQVNVMKDVETVDDGYDGFYEDMHPKMMDAANNGIEALQAAYQYLKQSDHIEHVKRFWSENSQSLKEVAQQADIDNAEQIDDAEVVDEPTTEA
ncbi:phage recombination protein Bet [Psychrobacter glaciei]|uniref:phage recombination protein Bet n=1 Tax=Psychrobacter glaciei TaxID=619771 RepID=UPI003F4689F3